MTGQGSRLVWHVRCAQPGKTIAEGTGLGSVAIEGVTGAPRMFGGTFVVPGTSCPAQWLTLDGVAAEFPTLQSATLSRLFLTPVGAR